MAKKESKAKEVVTREYTVNLHKRLHSLQFKKRAPRAIKEIKKFAQKMMKTKDVRLDVKLNKLVWSQGVKNVPNRLRIIVQRRRNDDEDAKVRRGAALRAAAALPAARKQATFPYLKHLLLHHHRQQASRVPGGGGLHARGRSACGSQGRFTAPPVTSRSQLTHFM